jgi:hypothetical protein
MKLTRFLVAAALAALSLAYAEDAPAEHVAQMKEIAGLNGKINKGVDLQASAKRMSEVMMAVEKFWTPRDAAAGKLAGDAAKAAAALSAGTGDEAANKAAIGASCRGCHPAHREGAAAPYTIK